MPKIVIPNFTGGKNSRDHQTSIADNQCASGSYGVWSPEGYLTKGPGWTLVSDFTATATNVGALYSSRTIDTDFAFYTHIASSTTNAQYNLWGQATTALGYVTGSVSISGASLISATGSGTVWNTHASAGDLFRINSTAASWFKVSSVEDDTHLTLSDAVPVAVATGSAYTILLGIETQPITLTEFRGSLWAVNVTSLCQRYDGTQVTRVSAVPKAAFITVHKNYMFAARTTTAESRLYWSAVGDATSWPTNNFIDIERDKGKITGIASYGNELIVFKNYSIFKLVGEIFDPSNPTYSVFPIGVPPGFGFNYHNTISIHNNALVFSTSDGIFAYLHGTNTITKISDLFERDLISGDGGLASTLTNYAQRADAISYNGLYVTKAVDFNANTDNVFGIIDKNGAWWLMRVTDFVTKGGVSRDSQFDVNPNTSLGSTPSFRSAANSNGKIFIIDLNGPDYTTTHLLNDASTQGIPSRWVSKEFVVGYGTFKKAVIYFEKQTAGTFSFDWSVDQAAFVVNSTDMTVGRGNTIRKTWDVNQKGSSIQIRIDHSTASQTFRIFRIEIEYDLDSENRRP